jgi:hypothetical protein
MSDKIFDLEQQIMQCWNVVDDIDMLYEYFGDNEFFKDMYPKHADEIMNCMLGLKTLYQVKFEKTWNTFEQVSKEYREASSDRDAFKHALGSIPTGDGAWPKDDERIDNIGRNGNDGLYYTDAGPLYWEPQRKELGGDE